MAASGHAGRIVHDRRIGAGGRGRSAHTGPQRHGPDLLAYLEIDSAMREPRPGDGAADCVFFRAARRAALPGRGFRTRVDRASCQEIRGSQVRRGRRDQPTRAGVLQSVRRARLAGARLVFSGWPGEILESAELPPDATAVVTRQEMAETISLARRLQPNARRILVISGASDLDTRNEQWARELLAKAPDGLPFEFLIGLPLPDLASRLAAARSDTIAFYLSQFRDRDGRPYTPREVLRAISAELRAPPCMASSRPTWASAWWPESRNRTRSAGRLIAELIRDWRTGRSVVTRQPVRPSLGDVAQPVRGRRP